MSAQGLFSIGGIASGLDTTSIIQQLMQLERAPVRKLESKQLALQSKNDAWGMVNTKLSALRATVDNLSQPDRFSKLIKATSSNDAAVGATANPATGSGSLTFYVTALAKAHQLRGDTVADPTAALDGTTFSVTQNGTTVEVALDGTMSLQDVAAELNAAKAGFSASVVKVDDGSHRLVLASDTTGTANALSVSTDSTSAGLAMGDLQAAADAVVTIGEGTGAITVTRSSNTISDLAPGATITLKQVTPSGAEPITVSTSPDVDAAVSAVKAHVDALNGALNMLSEMTRYNPDTGKAGALQGDATARQVLEQLRSAATVTGIATDGGGFHSAYQIGIEVDRHGAVTLDEAKLREALEQDFAGVGRMFAAAGTSTDPLAESVTGTSATASGTHHVEVTRAAEVALVTGALYTPPGETEPKTFRISTGGKTVTVTIDSTKTTAQQAVQAISDALADAGVNDLRATATADDRIQLATSHYGSKATFSVEELDANGDPNGGTAFGLTGTHIGVDVEGTINGEAATGSGRTLTATSGAAEGLSLVWVGSGPSAAAFDVTVSRGLAGGLGDVLATMEGSTGTVATARSGLTSRIDAYDDQIEAFEVRLTTREATLVKQFTAMETALSNLQAQGNWLSSQLSSLNGLSQQK